MQLCVVLHLEDSLCGAATWTCQEVDQKYLESFGIWRWRRVEKISWTDRVANEEVLHGVKEERNILHTVNRRKANLIGHILRGNCLLKHVIGARMEGRIEVTGRRARKHSQLLDYLKEKRGYRKLEEETLNRPVKGTRFGGGRGPVVRPRK
jgi:hypothetical protein